MYKAGKTEGKIFLAEHNHLVAYLSNAGECIIVTDKCQKLSPISQCLSDRQKFAIILKGTATLIAAY